MFCLKRQSVPRSKQSIWVIRASQSVLYGAKSQFVMMYIQRLQIHSVDGI